MLKKTTAILIIISFLALSASAQTAKSGEISVSAYKEIASQPPSLGAYFLLSSIKESAEDAHSQIQQTENNFLKACKNLEFKKLGEHISFNNPINSSSSSLGLGSSAKSSKTALQKSLEFSVEKAEHLAKIIDIAKKMGIELLGSTKSSSKQSEKARDEAIALAITEIKSKASLIAKDLGVTLGKIISASVTEESQNMAAFRGQKVGGVAATTNPPAARVLVQARFKTK